MLGRGGVGVGGGGEEWRGGGGDFSSETETQTGTFSKSVTLWTSLHAGAWCEGDFPAWPHFLLQHLIIQLPAASFYDGHACGWLSMIQWEEVVVAMGGGGGRASA